MFSRKLEYFRHIHDLRTVRVNEFYSFGAPVIGRHVVLRDIGPPRITSANLLENRLTLP